MKLCIVYTNINQKCRNSPPHEWSAYIINLLSIIALAGSPVLALCQGKRVYIPLIVATPASVKSLQIWPTGSTMKVCENRETHRSCCAFTGDDPQQYVFIGESKTWFEAQSYCRENHTDLVSVRNQTENQQLLNMIPNISTIEWVWIGLFRNSWKWSDHTNSSYHNWATGEPSNEGEKGNCAEVQFEQAGKWKARPCDVKNPFICYEGEFIRLNAGVSLPEGALGIRFWDGVGTGHWRIWSSV